VDVSTSVPDVTAVDPLLGAKRRGSRYLTVAFSTVAAGFIVLSLGQLTMAVFGVGPEFFRAPPPTPLAASPCTEELQGLAASVERAVGAASRAPSEGDATATYRRALSPAWDDEAGAARRCNSVPHGAEALAAVLRLRQAGEEAARRQVIELGPVRHEVSAYLGGPESVPEGAGATR
jgi:hypothetical protein